MPLQTNTLVARACWVLGGVLLQPLCHPKCVAFCNSRRFGSTHGLWDCPSTSHRSVLYAGCQYDPAHQVAEA